MHLITVFCEITWRQLIRHLCTRMQSLHPIQSRSICRNACLIASLKDVFIINVGHVEFASSSGCSVGNRNEGRPRLRLPWIDDVNQDITLLGLTLSFHLVWFNCIDSLLPLPSDIQPDSSGISLNRRRSPSLFDFASGQSEE